MPYEIDPTRRLVTWTHTGSELPGVWTRTLESILADPRFAPGFNILEDLRADADVPHGNDVRKGAATLERYADALGSSRWAVVLRPDSPAFYGMLRMAQIPLEQTGTITLRPFTDLDAAHAWLDS